MKAISSAFVTMVVLLIVLGLTIGLLVNGAELLHPRRTELDTLIASQQWQAEQQRQAQELQLAQQRQAQELQFEQQRQATDIAARKATGAAWTKLISEEGPMLMRAVAIALVVLATGVLVVIVSHVVDLFQSGAAAQPARSQSPPQPQGPQPLIFPTNAHAQQQRKRR